LGRGARRERHDVVPHSGEVDQGFGARHPPSLSNASHYGGSMNAPAGRSILRSDGRVTDIELFFDLVFVFAVTQLSRTLVQHLSFDGAVQTAVLLAVVWQ